MDPIVTIALVGTANQGPVHPVTSTPVDELTEGLGAIESERKLLLSAGAWSIYRQAGQKPQQIAIVPEVAEPETRRPCSSQATHLLSHLLSGKQEEILLEALVHMREAQLYLPHKLLVQALDNHGNKLRAALAPVLGERGRWLSAFNSSWRWVQDYLPDGEDELSREAEKFWQVGTTAQRAEVLRRKRAADPVSALAQLRSVWKQEKADTRAELFQTLEVGLSLDDEEFLEQALDDRATGVRQIAAVLLTSLPGSAYLKRMRERAEAMLSIKDDQLLVKLPAATIAKDWLRDGIIEEPPVRSGKRIWWLQQVLACVPLTFWETYLGTGPKKLIELAAVDDKWRSTLIGGWVEAAVHFHAPNWLLPLWQWWSTAHEKFGKDDESVHENRQKLLGCFPPRQAEHLVLDLLYSDKGGDDPAWLKLLPDLSSPWSEDFAFACLNLVREQCLARVRALLNPIVSNSSQYSPYGDPWFVSLETLVVSLPLACFAEARQGWKLATPEGGEDWQFQYAKRSIHTFTDAIKLRQEIHKEIF